MTLFLLLACGQDVAITPSTGGCQNYDFDSPAQSTLEWETAGAGAARVWRTNGLLDQTGLVFDPTFEFEGDIVHVHEAWAGGETDEAFCYAPELLFEGITSGLEVRWYLEGDQTPFSTIDVEGG